MRKGNIEILFTGYAYVHFVCFRPLYNYLACRPDVDLFVSGGLRTRNEDHYLYDAHQMYQGFSIDENHILTVDQIRQRSFDLLFAANTKMILPGSVKKRIQIYAAKPLDIIIAENIRNASAMFFNKLLKHLPKNFPLKSSCGLIETSTGKMVPLIPGYVKKNDPLLLWAEPYNTLILDRKGFKNHIPPIPQFKPVNNI